MTKRYLVLPTEGIRLSDMPASSDAAKSVLRALQPGRAKALASLERRLFSAAHGVTAVGRAGPPARATAGRRAMTVGPSASTRPAITVVTSLGEDGVKLVVADAGTVTLLRQQNPGVRVIEERFCHQARAPRVAMPRRTTTTRARAGSGPPVVVRVLRGDTGAPVRGAEVMAFRTASDALERRTNASGEARFGFHGRVSRLSRLYVYHEEPGVWGHFKKNVKVTDRTVVVRLAPLSLSARDSLRHFHKAGSLGDGTGVRVGVIDSGADRGHPDLKGAIEGGANCVPGSARPPGDFGPDDAHGTHVAGTIAARGSAPTGVRGVAPGARLRIYRVFEGDHEGSGSSFAIIDAIERAIQDKCDIINLSLGFDPGVSDEGVSDALRKARNHGILAVAAAGNGGREPVEFPASDDTCVAVSASGRKGLFPVTATEVDDIDRPFGTDRANFIGAFSNVGADLDATGAGVGVVSTFPGGYGPMSGTSMASPAVAGMAARLLGANRRVRTMKRNAARADAIRQLLINRATSLGFGALFEGAGLPR